MKKLTIKRNKRGFIEDNQDKGYGEADGKHIGLFLELLLLLIIKLYYIYYANIFSNISSICP